MERFASRNPRAVKFFQISPDKLDVSMLLGIIAINQEKQLASDEEYSYWERIGYELGGAAVHTFSKFISDEVKRMNISHVAFIARDGYNL